MARPTLFSNRKFLKLATRLQSEALALGHLEFLWHAANESGNPLLGDADDVEATARWRGQRGELVAALVDCGSAGGAGFIIRIDDGRYEIHDYWHHAPDYVRKRAKREQERVQKGNDFRQNGVPLTGQKGPHIGGNDQSSTGQSPAGDRSVTGQNSAFQDCQSGVDRTPTLALALALAPAPAPTRAQKKDTTAASRPVEPEFIEFRSIYPKRNGNQPWGRARKAINARIADGHTWQEILDGARRYAEWCKATGKANTETVLQAATFCGPDKGFLAAWTLPATKADTRLAGNLSAAAEFMRRTEVGG